MPEGRGVTRRCVRWRVPVLDCAFGTLERTRPRTIVFDVEPLVATWGSSAAALARGIKGIEARADSIACVSHLVFMTNSRRVRTSAPDHARLEVMYVARAGKPWKVGALRCVPAPVAVVGDQVLTDGLLAWRLRRRGAEFIQVRTQDRPWWPWLQGLVGAVLAPLLFAERSYDGNC